MSIVTEALDSITKFAAQFHGLGFVLIVQNGNEQSMASNIAHDHLIKTLDECVEQVKTIAPETAL